MPGETKLVPEDMPPSVRIDFIWSSRHSEELKAIIRANLPAIAEHMDNWREASAEEDMHKATDFVLTSLSVAARVRRSGRWQKDITIRSWRPSEVATELQKLKSGDGDIMIYAWTNSIDAIDEWAIIDLHLMRSTGTLENPTQRGIDNKDGSSAFDAWDMNTLRRMGCIIAEKMAA